MGIKQYSCKDKTFELLNYLIAFRDSLMVLMKLHVSYRLKSLICCHVKYEIFKYVFNYVSKISLL